MKHLKLVISYTLFCVVFLSEAQTIHDINDRLGRGINYGNMMEAPSEQEWGNPWEPEYPEIIASLGFNHVRMPIRWEPAARSDNAAPFTINPTFLDRIKEIVDATLENELMVVINMHHHDLLYDDPDGQKERFLAQWQQISSFFKDYSDSLVFEILNEPHGNMTPEKWNEFAQDALDVIRVDNPTRAVLIGTPEYGGLGGLSFLELPDDDNIIITVHYYNPFQFTHQGAEWVGEVSNDWLGTEWNDTDLERDVVQDEFAPLLALSEEENIPVHIGEFGAYSTADLISRGKWTTYLSRYFEELGWSWAYWEFSAGFGIYNPATEAYVEELVDALLVNEMPEPAIYQRTLIYQSDFTTDLDGWFLNVDTGSGASAELSKDGEAIKVTISQLGAENWHIQLMRDGFSLEEGKTYAFTFTGSATESKPAGFYMGMNMDPWSQYGATSVTVIETENSYSGVFDMGVTDPNARLVFDIGGTLADFMVTAVKVEELSLLLPNEPEEPEEPLGLEDERELRIFPNPVNNELIVENAGQFNMIKIYDLQGHKLVSAKINEGINRFSMMHFPKGIYMVDLSGIKANRVYKIIRQ